MTSSVRNDGDQLLIQLQKTHRGVSTDTIARWLKLMSAAEIGVQVFSTHSTRSAATFKANYCHVPIDTILAAAAWTNAKTFAMYYNKPIWGSTLSTQLLNNKDS